MICRSTVALPALHCYDMSELPFLPGPNENRLSRYHVDRKVCMYQLNKTSEWIINVKSRRMSLEYAMNINGFTSSHHIKYLNLSALKLYLICGAQFVMHKQITENNHNNNLWWNGINTTKKYSLCEVVETWIFQKWKILRWGKNNLFLISFLFHCVFIPIWKKVMTNRWDDGLAREGRGGRACLWTQQLCNTSAWCRAGTEGMSLSLLLDEYFSTRSLLYFSYSVKAPWGTFRHTRNRTSCQILMCCGLVT